MRRPKAILIGGSAGSVNALQEIFKHLSDDFDLPIVIVQHLPQSSRVQLDLVYSVHTRLKLQEAGDKTEIQPGTVYFAPASYHLLIEKDLTLSLSQDEPLHYSRPSIDVLFESAALSLGSACVAVLLTGANADGAAGLCFLNQKKALTIVQDPRTAEVAMMPAAALKPGFSHLVLDLSAIGQKLSRIAKEGLP